MGFLLMRPRLFVQTRTFKTLWLFNIQLQFIAPKIRQCIFYLQLSLSTSFSIELCFAGLVQAEGPEKLFPVSYQLVLICLFIYFELRSHVVQTDLMICMNLELLVFLLLLPKPWDDRHYANMPSVGKEPQVLHMQNL